MSHPIRSLAKRTLPPLIKPGAARTSISSRNKADFELQVTEYLISNPEFVEAYLEQHFGHKRLSALVAKMEKKQKETDEHYLSKQVLMEDLPQLCSKLDETVIVNEVQEDNEELRFQRRAEIFNIMISEFSQVVSSDLHRLYLCNKEQTSLVEVNSNEEFNLSPNPNSYACTTVAQSRKGFIQSVVILDNRFSYYSDLKDTAIGSALVIPLIMHRSNELIGVLELYRNDDKLPFYETEHAILHCYCMCTSILLFFMEVLMVSRKDNRVNNFIIDVTQKMFGQYADMDGVIKEIMGSAKSLVSAERVTLFLLNKDNQLHGSIFDFGTYGTCKFEKMHNEIRFDIREGIAGFVADTGLTVNVCDAYSDVRFNKKIDFLTGYTTQTILATPVTVDKEITGVVQMLNKKNGFFTKDDEIEFSTFAKYCGLALKIGKMYGNLLRYQEKIKVTMDVLSYHSCCTKEEYMLFKRREIPADMGKIQSLEFWPWTVDKNDTVMYVLYMFESLFNKECFDTGSILKFILTVRKNYRSVPYHNWYHAFSVTQSMYSLLIDDDCQFNTTEKIALFIGCLCHDLDHRGRTNQFMVESYSTLSNLYSTSTMEHHHFNMTISILQRTGHNIFQFFSNTEFYELLSKIKHSILATDLLLYLDLKKNFQVNKSTNAYDFKVDWSDPEMRLTYMSLSMTFCDLSAMFRAWEMQLVIVFTIMEEFWSQGDEEREHTIKEPIPMMDRRKKLDMPKIQYEFFDFVCTPCYQLVKYINPKHESVAIAVQRAIENRNKWHDLAILNETDRSIAIRNLKHMTKKFMADKNINM